MPKAEPTEGAAVVRAPAPKSALVKNQPLPVPVAKTSSQAVFGTLEEEEEFLRVVYFGREGSAKSTNAASVANTGKTLFINAEGGAKRRALIRQGINPENIVTWPKDRITPITNAGLEGVFQRLRADLVADPNSWHAVVMDSATEVVQVLTAQVSDNRVMKAQLKGADIDEVDEFFTDVADYGTMGKMITDKIRKFRDLPLHVIYTALERRDVEKASGEVIVGPAVSAGVATNLLGFADFVIHCTAGDEEMPFRGLTKEGGRFRVKDRFDILPRVMVEPTMERIIQYAQGEFDEKLDPKQALLPAKAARKSGKKTKTATEDKDEDNAETE